MGFAKSLIMPFFVCVMIAPSVTAGEQPLHNRRNHPHRHATASAAAAANPLDRVADAVDGVESSHGKDPAMWRPDPAAPQGPMQVSEAAATDIGGGDRFDFAHNRALGRAYLSLLYLRYHNWPDTIAAYNWGIRNTDAWVKAGRPHEKLLAGVAMYLQRVLNDSGLCNGGPAGDSFLTTSKPGSSPAVVAVRKAAAGVATQAVVLRTDSSVYAACARPDAGSGGLTVVPNRFYKQLDAALQLAVRRAAQDR